MFLGGLSETEKQAFLCLANQIMKADGVVADSEMAVINALRGEMNTQNLLSNLTEDESLNILASSKRHVKRGIYIELLSIAIADGTVDASEEAYIKKIQSKLDLSDVFAKNAGKWIDTYFRLLEKGINLARGKKKDK